MAEPSVRIVLAKIGLDDHQRALLVLSKVFRDAGFEVVNLGAFQTPEMVVRAAIAEDVDAIGLSFHTLTYLGWVADVIELLHRRDADGVPVFVGGTIPEADDEELRRLGVAGIYRPGSAFPAMIDDIRRAVRVRSAAKEGRA